MNGITNSTICYKSQQTSQMEDSSFDQLRRFKVHSTYNLDFSETETPKLHFKTNISYSKGFQVQLLVDQSLVNSTMKPVTLTANVPLGQRKEINDLVSILCAMIIIQNFPITSVRNAITTCRLYAYVVIQKTLFPEGCDEKTQDDLNLHEP